MTRRRFERRREEPEGTGSKPTLESVLDLYAVDYQPYRSSQMVRCPLHQDNTPSCSVNTDSQLWRCHSCGEGGDAYTLIMRMEDKDFDGARKFAEANGLQAASPKAVQVPARRGRVRTSGGKAYTPSWRGRS